MRILVTGGAGFIGSHVAAAYRDSGHDVLIVDNLSTGKPSNVPEGIPFREVDILSPDIEAIFASFKPEVVNHHAAQASVKVGSADPVADLAANGGGTARIASLCVAHGARKIIYSASGGTVYGEPEILPVPETHPLRPVSNYGLSKLVGEQYIQLANRTAGLDYTILRYSNAFGPRQDPHGEAGVVAIFTGRMRAGEQCTIDGDGEQKKDYIYVGDIARANLIALEKGGGAILNIGTGQGTTVNTIFQALHQATGNTVEPRNGPPRPGDVRNFWFDCTLAKQVVGWQATTSFEEGIALTVASYG